MKTIKIGNKNIGIDLPVFFIAEAGVNHNNGIDDQHLPLKKNMWHWKIINDPYFSKVYKILEFRNTSIKNIKNVFNYF